MKKPIIYKVITNTLLAFNFISFVIYIFSMYSFFKHSSQADKLVMYIPGLIFIISIVLLNGIRNDKEMYVYGYMVFIAIVSILSGVMEMFILSSIVNLIGSLVIFYMFRAKLNRKEGRI